MATDNEMRTLIALGAFSSVQGGGDIPEDLEVHSVTACSVTAGTLYADGPLIMGSGGTIFASGPIVMFDNMDAPVNLEAHNGLLTINHEAVHIVGTRHLQNGDTMRGGRYYYISTECSPASQDYSGVQVHCNETAEIWIEVGCTRPENFTLPCAWNWIGTELPTCLQSFHFYDIAARHVKGVGTVANVAFDTPVGS